jgi:uncharacterized protein (TIGR00369 family)
LVAAFSSREPVSTPLESDMLADTMLSAGLRYSGAKEAPMLATALDRIPAPPSARLLGWHLLDARPKDGWVRIGFDGKRGFCNPAGFVQGGMLCAMLDDTMGPAVFVMTDGALYTATTSMTVNFLAPARPGPIIGEAIVTQLGKTIAFVEGRLLSEDGTALAIAGSNARLVEADKAIRRLDHRAAERGTIGGLALSAST